jgi:hypothetical protein
MMRKLIFNWPARMAAKARASAAEATAVDANAPQTKAEPLLHLWAAWAALLLFAGYVLYQQGVWSALLLADPTFLTAIIVLIFASSTVWVGLRAQRLEQEMAQFAALEQMLQTDPAQALVWLRTAPPSWARDHALALCEPEGGLAGASQVNSLLGEHASAAHEMVWWINGVLLKLGLLGKVIGFSIMAMQLGAMENFDPSQTSAILKTLTGGLGIALLTTITGLSANMLLGLQLMRLDRFADAITAKGVWMAQTLIPRLHSASQKV